MTIRRRVISLVVVLAISWGGLAFLLWQNITPKLGLDLQGGTSVVLTAPEGTDPDVMEVAVEIMRNRIEEFGSVQEPEIAIAGDRNVLVQLPGVTDQERALGAIGQTGRLSFRPVLNRSAISPLLIEQQLATAPTTTVATSDTSATETTEPTTTTTFAFPEGVDPETGLTIDDDPADEAWLPELDDAGEVVQVYHVGPAFIGGVDIDDAIATVGGGSSLLGGGTSAAGWAVQLDLTSEGGDKFEEGTKALAIFPAGDPRRELAIVLDGEVISAPPLAADITPDQGISGGRALITMGGEEQESEAKDLAVVLRYGSLPVAFERSSVETVSATLGSDSLRAGLVAGIGGLILVAVAVVLYYRALGLVTVVGLSVFGSLLVIVFSLLGEYRGLTLTLAGVAGVIVSVGITADSYIVYYERIKDEIRRGRTVRSAVDDGFRRAFRTILTADTVSLLGAGLLWLLAIGPVKGFALALGIATILDVIIAYFFTRHAVALLAATRLAESGFLSIRAAAGLPQEREALA